MSPHDVVVTPLFDNAGAVVRLLAVARSVAQYEKSQKTSDDLDRQIIAVADHMAQLAWLADADGNIVWFNKRWYDFSGTSPGRYGERRLAAAARS
ncbi:MAG: hypothetical protein R3D67_17420 [Hyphomicrobiaceae bacterium]